MTIRAGRFFRAGTHGQRFSHPGGAYATGIGVDRSLRGGRPPTAEEGRELMEWDARPENQLHRMSDLMPMSEIQTMMHERTGGRANAKVVNDWVMGDRSQSGRPLGDVRISGGLRGGGVTIKPNFPGAVTPEEWTPTGRGAGGRAKNKLWRRSDVERWSDVAGVSPDMHFSAGGRRRDGGHGGGIPGPLYRDRPGVEGQDDIRPDIPPIRTTTVSELISNMDERFKAEGGTLHEPGTKDEHGNPRGKQ